MTRINTGILPSELPDRLLIAELREIKRIPNLISKGRYSLEGVPEQFCLGTGHVKFFYNKLGYLLKRYKALKAEADKRGFKVQDYSRAWDDCPQELMNGYTEQERDRALLVDRIKERGFELKVSK